MKIDRNFLAVLIVGLAAVFFLMGADDGFRKADQQATKADRVRVICATPMQSMILCKREKAYVAH